MDMEKITELLRQRLPDLQAVYCFGSYSTGHAGPESDLDLAILLPTAPDPVQVWELAGEVADLVDVAVDLVDLRSASTIMQFQVITHGQRLWAQALPAGLFECLVVGQKWALDTAREGVLSDILKDGRVYGR
jgi:predicted nucleotidyltransferase